MLGSPILTWELSAGSRRNRLYLMRWIYAGWLLLQFGGSYFLYAAELSNARMMAHYQPDLDFRSEVAALNVQFSEGIITLFVVQQFIGLLLATPVLSAGAITDEKERGTLQYLFSAGLTSSEIIVGKLLGRLVLIGSLVLVSLPFLFFAGVFAGLNLSLLVVVTVETGLAAFAIAAASILASVWARQTRDAVLALYSMGGLGLLTLVGLRAIRGSLAAGGGSSALVNLLSGVDELLRYFDPIYTLEAAWETADSGEVWRRLLLYSFAWGSIGMTCLMLSIARLRGAYIRQLEGAGKLKLKLLVTARPAIAREPIRWKERFVVGLAPLPWMRLIPRWLGIIVIALASMTAGIAVLAMSAKGSVGPVQIVQGLAEGDLTPVRAFRSSIDRDQAREGFYSISIAVGLIASLAVGIRCSGAITGEREKHTWEALLLTPLTSPQLVRAKLWGVIGASYLYLAAYAIPTLALSVFAGAGAVAVVVISLGVIWLAMFYVGATGLWCSARSTNSWRSLLGMLGWAYLGGFLVFFALFPLWCILSLYISMIFYLLKLSGVSQTGFGPQIDPDAFFLTVALVLVGMFLLGSWLFIRMAEKRVADYDRTRHWRDEPIRRPRRRPRQIRLMEEAEEA